MDGTDPDPALFVSDLTGTVAFKLILSYIWYYLRIKIFCFGLFGTDPDRNRVTWETPSSEAIPFCRKPFRRAPPT